MPKEDDEGPAFKQATVEEIFKHAWTEPGTRINGSALHLSAEYLRTFVIEAIHRAAEAADEEAEKTGKKAMSIEVEHLEKIMAGLLLDFA